MAVFALTVTVNKPLLSEAVSEKTITPLMNQLLHLLDAIEAEVKQ